MKSSHYPSSPVVSDSNSTFSDESHSYTITDLNEVTRQTSIYKEKLRVQREIDIKEVLKLSAVEDNFSVVANIPTEILLPESSVTYLQSFQSGLNLS